MSFSALAQGPQSRGDFGVAQWVGGQVKLLGLWVNLPANANVEKVGVQVTDNKGENFVFTVDADWAGWKWIEGDLTGGKFVSAGKPAGRGGKIDCPAEERQRRVVRQTQRSHEPSSSMSWSPCRTWATRSRRSRSRSTSRPKYHWKPAAGSQRRPC